MLSLRRLFNNETYEAKPLVPMSWIERATRESEFTPDIARIEQYESRLVFLYNEAMEGHRKHTELVGRGLSLGTAYTVDHNMSMWKKKLGNESFPIAMQGIKQGPPMTKITSRKIKDLSPWSTSDIEQGRIKGELHLLGPGDIKTLDEYMRNGVEFRRSRSRTLMPFLTRKQDGSLIKAVHVIRADLYLGIKEYWEDQLDGGFRFSLCQPCSPPSEFQYIKTYYHYTLDEHNEFKNSRITSTLP